MIALAIILGALGRRIAGGLWNSIFGRPSPGGDMPVRLIFAAALSLAAYLGGVRWFVALILVPLNYIGTTTGNFDSLAMGRGGRPYWKDFLGMTLHGLLSALAPAVLFLVVAWPHPWAALVVIAAGLAISPCYTIGWAVCGLHGRSAWIKGCQQGPEIAELLWGGVMGAAAFIAAELS